MKYHVTIIAPSDRIVFANNAWQRQQHTVLWSVEDTMIEALLTAEKIRNCNPTNSVIVTVHPSRPTKPGSHRISYAGGMPMLVRVLPTEPGSQDLFVQGNSDGWDIDDPNIEWL